MRYLFCALASHGFVYPLIGIAQALQKKGHEVALVTGPAFHETITQADLQRIPFGEKDNPSFQITQWAYPITGALQIKHIKYAIDRFAPDVLVGDALGLGALVAGELFSLPVAVLGLATYPFPFSQADFTHPDSESAKRRSWRYNEFMRYYNQLRKQSGLRVLDEPPEKTSLLGNLFLLRSVPEFQEYADELPEKVHFVGSCLWEPSQRDPEVEAWVEDALASDLPILYVQHGSVFNQPSFLPALQHALSNCSMKVAISVGRMRSEVQAVPENFFIRDHISQGRIMQHARAVVANGNTTVVLGAISHGLPSLLIPNGGEQPDLAERCQRVGISRCLSPEMVTAYHLEEALETLFADPHMAQAARSLQAAFRYKGAEKAADILSTTFGKA